MELSSLLAKHNLPLIPVAEGLEDERRGSMSLHLNPEGLAQGMSYNALAPEPSRDLWTHVASHSHVHYTFLLCCTPPPIPMPTHDLALAVPSHGYAVADTAHA